MPKTNQTDPATRKISPPVLPPLSLREATRTQAHVATETDHESDRKFGYSVSIDTGLPSDFDTKALTSLEINIVEAYAILSHNLELGKSGQQGLVGTLPTKQPGLGGPKYLAQALGVGTILRARVDDRHRCYGSLQAMPKLRDLDEARGGHDQHVTPFL
jgi:hypothetical protein